MKNYFYILLFILPLFAFAQNKINTDSLVKETKNADIKRKIDAHIQLATFYSNNNFELASSNAKKALDLSLKNKLKKEEADAYHVTGLIEYYKGLRVFALDNFLKACAIRDSINDMPGLANSSNLIGLIYENQGEYENALERFYTCLKIRKELNDLAGIAGCYNNIGNVFRSQGDTDKGLEYYLKALETAKSAKSTRSIALFYNNIGYCYFLKNDLELAKEYYFQSLKIREKNNDLQGVTNVMTDLGNLFAKEENFEEAKDYLEKSYQIAKKINIIHEIQRAAMSLNKLYYQQEDYQIAYQYYSEYVKLTDSINSKQLTEKLTQIELQVKFEKEKQLEQVKAEKKDLENKREMEKAQFLLFILILGALALLIIALILFRNFKRKKRDNKILQEQKDEISLKNNILQQQKDEIETQRDEIETQRDFVTQQRDEIIKSKKEITDSIEYARKIQQAVLISNNDFKKILPDSFIVYKPRDIVSGDFYFLSKKSDKIILAVADCTGHGVPGAFMSMLGLTFFHDVVNEKGISRPNVILNTVRDLLITALKQNSRFDNSNISEIKDGMDVAVIALNIKTRNLEFAGANNPCFIIRKDSHVIEELKADKMPLGYHSNMTQPFSNKTVSISEGDAVYLFTDGFADQFGGKNNKKFKKNMFRQLLIWSSSRAMADQGLAIDGAFAEWKGFNEQVDDVLVVGVKI